MTKANPKLSRASKMPCKSWSLPAWEACPSARDQKGKPVDACEYCYALTGAYRFPSTIKARQHNMQDWKREGWVDAMVKAIGKSEYFRWFDSGDVYCEELAQKIYKVMLSTPNCKHWLPTRMHKDPEVYDWLRSMNVLDNVVVRYSSDSVHGKRLKFRTNSTIIQNADDFVPEKGYALCRAYSRNGKCKSCRACWSKNVRTVAYALHGHKVNERFFV